MSLILHELMLTLKILVQLTSFPLSQHAPMQPIIEPVNVPSIPITENAVMP